jgi:hypothetical protein
MTPAHRAQKSVSKLLGRACWQVRWGRVTGLDISFGRPTLKVREPLKSNAKSPRVRRAFSYREVSIGGQWWLWVTTPRWSLSLRDADPVTSATSIGRISDALRWLDGQKLVGFRIHSQTGATTLEFDLGAELTVRRRRKPKNGDVDELWSLYQPTGRVLIVRGDGSYSNESAREQRRWRPSD